MENLGIFLFLILLNMDVFLFGFLLLVYPMLPVSPDCPFLIASSVFSSVYLLTIELVHLL